MIQTALSRDLQDAIDFHHAVLAEGSKALVGYDTAKAVAFLCSSESVYITGEAMNVSGGEEMH